MRSRGRAAGGGGEVLLKRSLKAKRGPEHVQVAYTLQQLGRCVRDVGRLAEAEELLRRCLGILEAKWARMM